MRDAVRGQRWDEEAKKCLLQGCVSHYETENESDGAPHGGGSGDGVAVATAEASVPREVLLQRDEHVVGMVDSIGRVIPPISNPLILFAAETDLAGEAAYFRFGDLIASDGGVPREVKQGRVNISCSRAPRRVVFPERPLSSSTETANQKNPMIETTARPCPISVARTPETASSTEAMRRAASRS